MSEIQARLADINDRAAKAAIDRDRQFFSLIGLIWLVAFGAIIAFWSLSRADDAFRVQDLIAQETTIHG